MYIKIVSDDDSLVSVFECDEYNLVKVADKENMAVREDVIYCYPPEEGDFKATWNLWLYKDGEPKQVLLMGCIAYVMNDHGQTIDTIYTYT